MGYIIKHKKDALCVFFDNSVIALAKRNRANEITLIIDFNITYQILAFYYIDIFPCDNQKINLSGKAIMFQI